MSNQTKPKLNYWLCRLCIVIFCLVFTGLTALAKGGETGKATAQERVVTGKVIAASTGETLPGVNIVLKGTTTGTVTDLDGNFQLNVPSEGGTLVFSFIGYLSEEMEIGNKSVIDMTLVEDITALEEVVVIGYGSMQRTNVTGAISSVDAEEIEKTPVPNVIEALRGQVPGVRIERERGTPGSGIKFYIRGKNSIGDDDDDIEENEPLIVIDGIPMTGGNIADINPDDIESINILKDAAAASIYGSSGANGVILIQTKTGAMGKPSLTVNVSYGLTDVSHKPTMFNGEEYVQLKKDANEGAGEDTALDVALSDPIERANYDAGKWTNWHDLLLRQGTTKNVSIALSGGSENFSYYMNGDVYLEKGIVQHSDYNRYSLRLNTDYTPFKFLTIGAKVQLSKSVSDETGSAAVIYQNRPDFTDFLGNSPLGRTHTEDGEIVPTVKGDQFQYNPLFKYQETEATRKTNRNYINPYVEFKILDGLTYRINAFAEQRDEKFDRFRSRRYHMSWLTDPLGPNEVYIEFGENTTYLLDNIVNFNRTFADKHSVNATFVYGFQTYDSYILRVEGENTPTDLLTTYSLSGLNALINNFEIDPQNDNYVSKRDPQWAKAYVVGRLGYAYDRRYNVTLTMRRDGSSKFGAENRFGNFPSASFAWNVHNESFLEENPIISLLKYRISYGVMGNDNIRTFGYVSLTDDVTYPFSQTIYAGLTTGNAPNETLRWEKSNQLNTGLDFGVIRNRITGFFDYYNTRTTDLLLDEQISIVSGFESVVSNVGETENWGIDANLNVKILDGEFKWDVNVNWAKDKNKIVKLSSADVDTLGNPIDDEANGWFIGQDIDVIYDYKKIGIYQLGEDSIAEAMHPRQRNYGPGDPKIADVSGPDGIPDGVITADDRTFLGSPTPDWYGSIRNTFSYKGLELTVLIETVQGITKIDRFVGTLTGRDNNIKVDYWTPRNPTNDYPQPHNAQEYAYIDAVRVKDATYWAIRNVSLRYALPQSILKRIAIKNMSVYIQGNNLKYFTNFKNTYSPDNDVNSYPTIKAWVFGTKITL